MNPAAGPIPRPTAELVADALGSMVAVWPDASRTFRSRATANLNSICDAIQTCMGAHDEATDLVAHRLQPLLVRLGGDLDRLIGDMISADANLADLRRLLDTARATDRHGEPLQ
jgi:hypothetical protein